MQFKASVDTRPFFSQCCSYRLQRDSGTIPNSRGYQIPQGIANHHKTKQPEGRMTTFSVLGLKSK